MDSEQEFKLRQQREAFEQLRKVGVGKTAGVLMLIMVMFFSGFTAFGTFVISRMETGWYKDAVTVDGTVVSSRQETRTSSTTDVNGRPQVRRSDVTVLSVRYAAPDGTQMTRSVDAGARVYGNGETVRLAYQPNDAADVRLYQPNKAGMLGDISKVAGSIFAVALGLFLLVARKPRASDAV